MRSRAALAILAWTLLHPVGAASQPADLARLSCGQLLDLSAQDGERLMVWLHGYYAGAAQRPALDGRQFEAAMAAVRQACAGNRALPLIGAEARAIFLGVSAGAPGASPGGAAAPPAAQATPAQGRPAPLPSR